VERALASLPDEQRMAIVLSRYEGLSYREAAAAMGRSVQAFATLLFRAKETLRAKLGPAIRRGEFLP
ncbi:MAG: sigma factor-like helix-turn-helix DNA-binding protein, partial [candidate division WOR-3 bacterium]